MKKRFAFEYEFSFILKIYHKTFKLYSDWLPNAHVMFTCIHIEDLHNAVCTYNCIRTLFGPAPWFTFVRRGLEKNKTLIYFIAGFLILKDFNQVHAIFLSLSCNLVLMYELRKKLPHFVVFSSSVPYNKETKMEAMSTMMTCKIDLI